MFEVVVLYHYLCTYYVCNFYFYVNCCFMYMFLLYRTQALDGVRR